MEMIEEYAQKPVIEYEWRQIELRNAQIPTTRCNTASVLLGDKVYVVCGRGVGQSNEVWALNLSEQIWEHVHVRGEAPAPRDAHSVTKINDTTILIFGGRGLTREPDNERSERSSETQKIKSLAQKEVYNDMFCLNCDEKKWFQIFRKSRWPTGRRGHTATFIPPDRSRHNKHGHKSKVTFPFEMNDHPNTKGLLVVYGGAGIEAAWGTEQILNELWIYNFENEIWTHQRPRGGFVPPPVYEHTAALVGDQVVIVGGIVAPHKPSQYADNDETYDANMTTSTTNIESNSPPPPASSSSSQVYLNGDVLILNTKTWVWSTLEIINDLYEPASIGLHGHSMVIDPYNTNQLIIFGGKETGDLRQLYEYKSKSQSLLTNNSKKKKFKHRALLLNLHNRTLSPWFMLNDFPEPRYGHTCVAIEPSLPVEDTDNHDNLSHNYFSKSENNSMTLGESSAEDNKQDSEEVIMYLYGGTKEKEGGFCPAHMHMLIRKVHWEDHSDLVPHHHHNHHQHSSLFDSGSPRVQILDEGNVSYDYSDSNSFEFGNSFNRPLSPNPANDNSPRHLLMREAANGRVGSNYDQVKRALLISRCVKVHHSELHANPLDRLEVLSKSSRSSRRSSKSIKGNNLHSRPSTTPGSALNASSLTKFSNSLPIGSFTKSGHLTTADLNLRKSSSSRIEALAKELPPLIRGLSKAEARVQYKKLYPPPTKQSLFGENDSAYYTMLNSKSSIVSHANKQKTRLRKPSSHVVWTPQTY